MHCTFITLTVGFIITVSSGINCSGTGVKRAVHKSDLTKIFSENLVYIDEYPFTVSVQRLYVHRCGGVLVRYDWVLTAAHCTHEPDFSDIELIQITIVAGMTITIAQSVNLPDSHLIPPPGHIDPHRGHGDRLPEPTKPGHDNIRKVVGLYLPKTSDKKLSKDDVALYKLEFPFKTDLVKIQPPRSWPDKALVDNNISPDTWCTVVGWGWKTYGNKVFTASKSLMHSAKRVARNVELVAEKDQNYIATESNRARNELTQVDEANKTKQVHPAELKIKRQRMRYIGYVTVNSYLGASKVQTQSKEFCWRKIWGKWYKNESTQVCTSEHGSGTCSGDSGGPLICNGYVVGITSYGARKCASHDSWSMYTRMDYIMAWMNETIDAESPLLLRSDSAGTVARATFMYTVAICILIKFLPGMCFSESCFYLPTFTW